MHVFVHEVLLELLCIRIAQLYRIRLRSGGVPVATAVSPFQDEVALSCTATDMPRCALHTRSSADISGKLNDRKVVAFFRAVPNCHECR